MNLNQMTQRCPMHRIVGAGCAWRHRLVFPRFSTFRQCGVASIEVHESSAVWGVVVELSDSDAENLDRCEGHQPDRPGALNNYNRKTVEVEIAGTDGRHLSCWTYIATPQDGDFLPSENYIGLMIDGAAGHALPDWYIDHLRSIRTQD